ncbi:MAG TPA: hypothetical protein VFS72_05810, partial [Agromyces sp.]|nr:hypothetical protein [Agromyces sp.]
MQRPLTRTRMAGAIAALAVASVLGSSLVAYADSLQDRIEGSATSVVLEAGSGIAKSVGIRLVANAAGGGDADPGCNIDLGDSPLVLDIVTPAGITATPDPLSLTSCGDFSSVSFSASSTATSGV